MTQDDSDWLKELFAAGVCDWTPSFARYAVRVLYAPVSCDPEVTRRCASILSDAELQRADRFVTEEISARFKQRRAFRRFCGSVALGSQRPLSQVVFDETEIGRPHILALSDVWFSFSACRLGFLGAWSSTHGIGVDIEDQSRALDAAELARRFFSADEAEAVERVGGPARLRTFFQLWSLKEAALKSIGEGLPFGLDAFQFELAPYPRLVHAPQGHGGPERFAAQVIEKADSCCAAVVIRSVA